jgi:two-component sensor histidine kinase
MPISGRFVVQSTIGLLAIGFLTLLAIVGMTIWLSEKAQVYSNDLVEARDIRTAAVELRIALQTAESSQRGFLTGGNEIYLAPYDTAKLNVRHELSRLQSMMAGQTDRQAMMHRLSDAITEKQSEMDQTVGMKNERRDDAALALFRTNRGKALMDEINVFLSSIVRSTDERLTAGAAEQKENADRLRLVSILGGLIIMIVVGAVTILAVRYTKEIAQARDEVRNLNTSLERRVSERTSALGHALDRANVLLAEVNHRVANSLTLVASLVRLQSKSVQDDAAKAALGETETRIYAIADVHKRLYNSGDVHFVALNEYLLDLLKRLESSMQREGHGATLRFHLDPLQLDTDASINLGIVLNEWVTNAFKYAYPDSRGEVRVSLRQVGDGWGELIVEDDGIGKDENAAAKGTGLGTRLVNAMATNVGGEIQYLAKHPGTSARFAFPLTRKAA